MASMTVADRIGHGFLNHAKDGILHHDIQINLIPVIGEIDLQVGDDLVFVNQFQNRIPQGMIL